MSQLDETIRPPRPPYRIGADVGGTFTDVVLVDATGQSWVGKVPSVPTDPGQGVIAGLGDLSSRSGVSVEEILRGTSVFVHGSTIATNTLIEGTGVTVGLFTTAGFRDALEIRRGFRENQWDIRSPYPPVMVPRYLRWGVGGRIDRDGREIQPLAEEDVRGGLAEFAEHGVTAVAIALFNSYLNPGHEEAVGRIVAAEAPHLRVSASSAIAPVMGEYERTSTAVVNAALLGSVGDSLHLLERRLRERGLQHPLLVVQSNGGVASTAQIGDRPVNLLLSGPAGGVGSLDRARAITGSDDLISMEIGGTSCDVMLMSAGNVALRDETMVGGYHVLAPAVDIHTIGAGGGAIAAVDGGGLLSVGPRGAGAVPGPACYGLGGEEPTATDAQVVLGRLRPGRSAGGVLDLDLEAAIQAIRLRVAEPLGLSVEEAATGIVMILERQLLAALEHISLERGHHTARFTLVAAGGAGPVFAASLGRKLGCGEVLVPRLAGSYCAAGMLRSDIRHDVVRSEMHELSDGTAAALGGHFDELEGRARQSMVAGGAVAAGDAVRMQRILELRYRGQLWSIRVPVSGAPDAAAVKAAFEREYDRLYGHTMPDGIVTITAVHVAALASTGLVVDRHPATSNSLPDPLTTRPVWHGDAGWLDTPVYDGSRFGTGLTVHGPLVIEEHTSTVLVGPHDTLSVTGSGDYLIVLGETHHGA